MKNIIKMIPLFGLCVAVSFGADKNYDISTSCNKSISFVLPVKLKIYQDMLNQLSTTTISLNHKAITKNLIIRLKTEKITPPAGMTIAEIAEKLYMTSVVPTLQPRIDAFNDLINKEVKEKRVSAGFISFQGVSEKMEKLSKTISDITLFGIYRYKNGNFPKGGVWQWNDKNLISGTTHFYNTIDGAINENIKFDLTPYGKNYSFIWNFSEKGVIKFEQTYDCYILGALKYDGFPETTVCVQPFVKLTLTKNINSNPYFKIEGNPNQQVNKKILHEAKHIIKIKAEKYNKKTS